MWNEELRDLVAYNPVTALGRMAEVADVIEGLVPVGGVTWLYGPSMSFKSFAVMSMAAAVSQGSSWLGRATEESVVVYLGAEGGDVLHVRRAAAEMQQGCGGQLVVAQERPMLDKPEGLRALKAILSGVAEVYWGDDNVFAAELDALEDTPAVRAARLALEDAKKEEKRAIREKATLDYQDKAYGDVVKANEALKDAMRKVKSSDERAAFDAVRNRYAYQPQTVRPPIHCNILCIIDTFSQTAQDDNRSSVSAYIKNLRNVIEEAALDGFTLSFLVVDHVTKEGGTYLGSVAKLNDVDSQLEMARLRKSMLATITQTKNKNAPESDPVHIELKPFELEGFVDVGGRPLRTLVVAEGEAASELLARQPEGNAAMLLDLLRAHGGRAAAATVRREFREMRIEAGARRASADKAYLRSIETLQLKGIAVTDGEDIVLV